MRYTVVLSPESDGAYSVVCPALPGCVSQGDDLDDALANIREAMELWLEVSREEDEEPPIETPEVLSAEIAAILRGRAEQGMPMTIETRVVDLPKPVVA